MGINRFSNKNILIDSKEPVPRAQIYDEVDLNKMDITNLALNINNFSSTSKVEYHIYSENNYIQGSEYPLKYNTDIHSNYEYSISVNPEKDVRSVGITNGNYNVVYNFLDNIIPKLNIDSTSADGTEIQLSILNDVDSIKLKELYDIVNSTSPYKNEFVLNFGNDKLEPIVGIHFDNNKRIGEVVTDVKFPITNFGQNVTRFYPTDSGKWIEVIIPDIISNTINPVDESNNDILKKNVITYVTTGRTANFELSVNEDGYIGWQQELDGNGEPIYYTHNSLVEDRLSDIQPNIDLKETVLGKPTRATVRYYNNSLSTVNGLKNIVVKLYRELSDGLNTQRPTIDSVIRDSYIDSILVYPAPVIANQSDFSPPDFNLDLGYYGKSQGTSLKSWNDILDTNQPTANQIVNANLSSSFGNVKLNIDYSDFKNFVKYSSAVERVDNFKHKLELIENYNSRIETLKSVSGSNAITNISQSMTRCNSLISGFDEWEKWMYYETSGSLYTHYSSSAFTFDPWPKKAINPVKYPLELYETTSSIAETYYYGLMDSASYFDSINDSRLTKTIPTSIVEDDLNKDYLLFVDMIGQYFDIVWTYVKSLSSINSREEHPYDGMADELLYNVASSMGWELTHTKQRSDLWRYFIGTDRSGNPIQSGSLASKSEKQMNSEVWRRIVNNIPYLLKTKGSSRSVKALLSAYGIPQSFLSIREYGGPVIDESETQPYWEHDKFVYHLNFDGNNTLGAYSGLVPVYDETGSFIENRIPDTIELQFQQSKKDNVALIGIGRHAIILEKTGSSNVNGNIVFYMEGNTGTFKSASIMDVPIYDNKMSTLVVQREISTNDTALNNEYTIIYKRAFRDQLTIEASASIETTYPDGSSFNLTWNDPGMIYVSPGSLPTSNSPAIYSNVTFLTGKIQEFRFWRNTLTDSVINDHTFARTMYNGNTHTSSFSDLIMRIFPDSRLKTISGTVSLPSQHPNQKISNYSTGEPISASLYNFESDDLIGVTEEYYTRIPSAGANNIMSNKVRIEENRLTSALNPDRKTELSLYDKAPADTNQVGIYLSATQTYEYDIYNQMGYFSIDDYIGDPDNRSGYNEIYRKLNHLRRNIFKKYNTRNLINSIIDILARYDLSVFEQIRQTMPARVDYNSGILIEPHILERPKFKSTSNITYSDLVQNTVLKIDQIEIESDFLKLDTDIKTNYTLTSEITNLETSIDLVRDDSVSMVRQDVIPFGVATVVTPYNMATYKFINLIYSQGSDVGYGINWTTGSNGYWNYNPLGVTITGSRVSKYAQSIDYFYNTDVSASYNVYSSSSLKPSRVSTDFLPLGYANSKFNGCKMTSDSITTNSPDTPDGRPVIEVFEADPNTLIYTSETAHDGNLEVKVSTNVTIMNLEDLYVYDHIQYQNLKTYKKESTNVRRNLSKLQSVETARQAEFDLMVESQLDRERDEAKIRSSVDYFIQE